MSDMRTGDGKPMTTEELRALAHDIKNQLSGIVMAAEQLRYELSDQELFEDYSIYVDTITNSCRAINTIVSKL